MHSLSSELGPHIDRFCKSPRIYADANVPARLVAFMRERLRWDVFYVLEHPELRRASDGAHYDLARRIHRTLLTLDHDYFDDRRFPPCDGGGVIVMSAPDERGLEKLLRRIDRVLFRTPRPRIAGDGSNVLPLLGRKIHADPGWRGPEDRR